MANSGPKKNPAVDALRSSADDVADILSDLERNSNASDAANMREHDRLEYHDRCGLEVTFKMPNGQSSAFVTHPRNISRGGMSLLHGIYVYPDTRCTVKLETVDGQPMLMPATVVRCRHITGKAHEVSLKFDQLIELENFVRDIDGNANEADDDSLIPRFSGKILFVDHSKIECDLMHFNLKELHVTAVTASSTTQALQTIQQSQFDLVITELWFQQSRDGLDFIETLRKSHPSMPILLVTADECEVLHQQARDKGANDVMTKPFTLSQLIALLDGYLKRDGKADKHPLIISTCWPDTNMRPLILNYIEQLRETANQIAAFLAGKDMDGLHAACRALKGSAGGYGFPQISEAAAKVERLTAADNTGAAQITSAVQALVDLCTAACLISKQAA